MPSRKKSTTEHATFTVVLIVTRRPQFQESDNCVAGALFRARCEPEELVELLDVVNPANKAGRVTLITRMSSKYLEEHLPKLILAVQKAGLNVSFIASIVVFSFRWCSCCVERLSDEAGRLVGRKTKFFGHTGRSVDVTRQHRMQTFGTCVVLYPYPEGNYLVRHQGI